MASFAVIQNKATASTKIAKQHKILLICILYEIDRNMKDRKRGTG